MSGEQIVSTAVSSTNESHNQAIVNAAVNAGLDKDLAFSAAVDGGAPIESLAQQK